MTLTLCVLRYKLRVSIPHPLPSHTHTCSHTHTHTHTCPPSLSTLENYALWQLVYQYLPYLDQRFLTAYTDYSAVVGLSVQPQRYTTCIGVAQTIMPMALARPYADYVLPTGTKVSSGVKVCFCGLLHVSCTYMFVISLNHATCTCTSCITHSINVLIHRFKVEGGEGGGGGWRLRSHHTYY